MSFCKSGVLCVSKGKGAGLVFILVPVETVTQPIGGAWTLQSDVSG